ncbi:MAG: DinB family protein [Puia sp.]|nr:DinB family protein [Puia sp.]
MVAGKDIVAAEFYLRYIGIVREEDVLKALKKNTRMAKKMLRDIPRKKIDFAYAEGKWTIKEILQHLIDAERVFTYRALSFARKDTTPLPGFDENNWASAVSPRVASRKWKDLVEEFSTLRESTESLFKSFNQEELRTVGVASGHPLNALALGFIIAGHFAHHAGVIKDRYL